MTKFLRTAKAVALTLVFAGSAMIASAQNPIAQTCFSTDPAPMVSGGRLYVFTGHDEENADFFWMNDWRLFSTTDMVNWQDHGCPLAQCDFEWADDRAWAPQCIERNGKFYFYVPVHSKISKGMAIGVAVADKVEGPYKDALGKPLYEDGKWDHIDPTVWIDLTPDPSPKGEGSKGQAYIGWGNPKFYSAKLGDDMISLASEVKCDTAVGKAGLAADAKFKRYVEGPWLFKQRMLSKEEQKKMGLKKKDMAKSAWGKYFLIYAAGGVPECIAYSEGPTPQGPWTYQGEVMQQTNDTKSFTNHSGIIEYKGHNYFFYHTGWLPKGGGFARSACVEEFEWQKDGRMPQIKPTHEGPAPIATLNPYEMQEAETMAYSEGVRSEWNRKQGKVWVSDIHNGDWIKVREVDFAQNTTRNMKSIRFIAASALQGGNIEVRLDSLKGEKIADVKIAPTGGWEEWETFSAPIRVPADKHDVYFVFKGLKGCKLFNLEKWVVE